MQPSGGCVGLPGLQWDDSSRSSISTAYQCSWNFIGSRFPQTWVGNTRFYSRIFVKATDLKSNRKKFNSLSSASCYLGPIIEIDRKISQNLLSSWNFTVLDWCSTPSDPLVGGGSQLIIRIKSGSVFTWMLPSQIPGGTEHFGSTGSQWLCSGSHSCSINTQYVTWLEALRGQTEKRF